ncbi:MAG: hypothetical protein ACK4NX_02915, partial [Candidatus Paceibacteria bacterium]
MEKVPIKNQKYKVKMLKLSLAFQGSYMLNKWSENTYCHHLVGANSHWRPATCTPLWIANRRQETAPTDT